MWPAETTSLALAEASGKREDFILDFGPMLRFLTTQPPSRLRTGRRNIHEPDGAVVLAEYRLIEMQISRRFAPVGTLCGVFFF